MGPVGSLPPTDLLSEQGRGKLLEADAQGGLCWETYDGDETKLHL